MDTERETGNEYDTGKSFLRKGKLYFQKGAILKRCTISYGKTAKENNSMT